MLVVLRIAIGWHFLYQGIWKLEHRDFSSAPFLSQAKGPLADRYYALVPDFWGRERLDPEKALARLKDDRIRFAEQYSLATEQGALADRILAAHDEHLIEFFNDNNEAIGTYLHELDRLKQDRRDGPTRQLEYQKKRNWEKQKELQSQLAGWTSQLDAQRRQFHDQLAGLLSAEQSARGSLAHHSSLSKMDRLITYTNIAIGVALIVGLLTRVASFSGALFLLSIVLSQPEWPGIYPPAPPVAGRSLLVTKEVIEMLAMFALAALPVGRWGGLDFFVHNLLVRPRFGKRYNSATDPVRQKV